MVTLKDLNKESFDLYKDGKKRNLFTLADSNFAKNKETLIIVHDAHNFFGEDDASFGMSGRIHDAINQLGLTGVLVAGVECLPGVQRIREFSPVENTKELFENEEYAEMKEMPYFGKEYLDAIDSNLIPYLESKFKFKFDNIKTIMIGSSMGGVITTYAACEGPNKYDAYIAFSNAFKANEPYIGDFIESKDTIGTYYTYMGGKEISGSVSRNQDYIDAFTRMTDILDKKATNPFYYSFNSTAEHSELAGALELPSALAGVTNTINKNK